MRKAALVAGVLTVAPACLPGSFDDLEGRAHDAGPHPDAAEDAGRQDATAPADAAAEDGAVLDTGTPEVDAGPQTLTLVISDDANDAVFCQRNGGLDEFLHFTPNEGAAGFTIEVGTDGEDCRAGLRFELPLRPGTQIDRAALTLRRVGPDANVAASATMRVHVYEGSTVASFDDQHRHDTFSQHGPDGLWTTSVGGFVVGPTNAYTTSPELKTLLQHVIDGAGWASGNAVTLLLAPDAMPPDEYAQFLDAYAGEHPPTLSIGYR